MLAGSVIGVALVLRAQGRAGLYSALTNLCSHITDERALQSEPPPPAPPGAPPPPPPAAPPPPPAAPPPPGGLVPLTLNRPPKPAGGAAGGGGAADPNAMRAAIEARRAKQEARAADIPQP